MQLVWAAEESFWFDTIIGLLLPKIIETFKYKYFLARYRVLTCNATFFAAGHMAVVRLVLSSLIGRLHQAVASEGIVGPEKRTIRGCGKLCAALLGSPLLAGEIVIVVVPNVNLLDAT